MINNLAKKLVNKNETEIEDILYHTFRPEDSEKEKKGEKVKKTNKIVNEETNKGNNINQPEKN